MSRILLAVLCMITLATQIWPLSSVVVPTTVIEYPYQDNSPTRQHHYRTTVNVTVQLPPTNKIENSSSHHSPSKEDETAITNPIELHSLAEYPRINEEERKQQAKDRSAKMQFLRKVFPGIKKLKGQPKKELGFIYRIYPSPTTATRATGKDEQCNNHLTGVQRQVDAIQIHVIGWKRVQGIQSLLNMLQTANYSGWDQEIPLYIHIDGGSLPELSPVVNQFQWAHGPKYVDQRMENIGLRNMWLTSIGKAAKDAGNNTLLLVLEDDMEVAPVFFQWLLLMLDHYAPNPHCRDGDLVGFSLSPIVFQEIFFPFSLWNPDDELQGRYLPARTRHSAYLTTVPSSWGAACWSDHWNNFDAFVKERIKSPFYNFTAESPSSGIVVPVDVTPEYMQILGAAPNRWTKSWKRFMVDFLYAQGKVMLYPHLPGRKALAKALQADGEHGITRDSSKENPYHTELVNSNEWLEWDLENQLPPYNDLMVFGLDHVPRTRELLVALGTDHLNRIADECLDCSKLLKVWARPGWSIPSRSKSGYPFICVMDMYTSTAAMSSRHMPPSNNGSDEKFLLVMMDPLPVQATIPASATLQAYIWASILNRTLVLPTNTDEEQLLVDWRAYRSHQKMDKNKNRALHKDHKTISMEEFSSRNRTACRMIRVSSVTNSESSSQSDPFPELEIVDLRHLLDQSLPFETIKHLFHGCNDDVLAIDGKFFGNQELVLASK